MTAFLHDREQAFEAKFAHDAELRFLVAARRDKLFAAWAAETLHLSDQATKALVAAILHIPDLHDHNDVLVTRIAEVFAAQGHDVARSALAAALDDCARQAKHQLMDPPPDRHESLSGADRSA